MDLFDRIYRLHKILRHARRPVPSRRLREELECSRATINRIIREMRDYLGAPIEYDHKSNGYHYLKTGEHPFELPGLWFNASELYALLAAQQLLANVQPGLLDGQLTPLRERIEQILSARHSPKTEIGRRVRIMRMSGRRLESEHFRTVASAVLTRRLLHIVYHGRARDRITERDISPQRLVYYRDNWYLDAWDHGKRSLRSFSIDRIREVRNFAQPAKDIPDARLDAHFASSYGIFAGRPRRQAVLRFTRERTRWVSDEVWHPQQQAVHLADGGYQLSIPYADERELTLDILKYGPDVEVIAPPSLRRTVQDRLRKALARYAHEEPKAKRRVGTKSSKRISSGRGSYSEPPMVVLSNYRPMPR